MHRAHRASLRGALPLLALLALTAVGGGAAVAWQMTGFRVVRAADGASCSVERVWSGTPGLTAKLPTQAEACAALAATTDAACPSIDPASAQACSSPATLRVSASSLGARATRLVAVAWKAPVAIDRGGFQNFFERARELIHTSDTLATRGADCLKSSETLVALSRGGSRHCTAALTADGDLVTAAHCLQQDGSPPPAATTPIQARCSDGRLVNGQCMASVESVNWQSGADGCQDSPPRHAHCYADLARCTPAAAQTFKGCMGGVSAYRAHIEPIVGGPTAAMRSGVLNIGYGCVKLDGVERWLRWPSQGEDQYAMPLMKSYPPNGRANFQPGDSGAPVLADVPGGGRSIVGVVVKTGTDGLIVPLAKGRCLWDPAACAP